MPAPTQVVKRTRYSLYHKLFLLYGLNLVDWLCTEALLKTGLFYEANPLMSGVLPHFMPTLLLKGLLPLGMTLLCAWLFKRSGLRESPLGAVLLNVGIVAYSLVNLWHIVNFLLLFSRV